MHVTLDQPNGLLNHLNTHRRNFDDYRKARERGWNPYVYHGGTASAIAGNDFVVFCSDRRLSQDTYIVSRSTQKLWAITDKCVLASSFMQCDYTSFKQAITHKLAHYEFKIGRQPGLDSVASLIQKLLYSRRFFPYYTFNLVAGLKPDGSGVIYSYDAIGSYSPQNFGSTGSASAMLVPWIQANLKADKSILACKDKAVQLLRRGMTAAAERDTMTGDRMDVWILTKQGIQKREYQLSID